MEFIPAVKRVFFSKNYFKFSGRASRSEYWFSLLGFWLIITALMVLGFLAALALGLTDSSTGNMELAGALLIFVPYCLFFLYGFIPVLAVTCRRIHDLNHSGLWLILILVIYCIPLLGAVVGIGTVIWYSIKGTTGPNRFGEDPLAIDINPTDIYEDNQKKLD